MKINIKDLAVNIGLSFTSVLIVLLVLLVIDLYEHKKMSRYGGLNYRGYRGDVAGRKKTGEIRIIIIGGSCAFGYGVKMNESMPFYLEELLNERYKNRNETFRVINLAYNNEGAVGFMPTIRQFGYLDPDIVLLYSGYNDMDPSYSYYRTEKDVYRNKSFVFRKTGYMPILPLVLREKYYKLRYGSVGEGYKKSYQDFLKFKSKIFMFDRVSDAVLAEKERLTGKALEDESIKQYVGYIRDIAFLFTASEKGFIFIRPPKICENIFFERQQKVLKENLILSFGDNDLFLYSDITALFDNKIRDKLPKDISFDNMHLTPKGNRIVAEEIIRKMEPFIQNVRGELG